MAIETDFNGLNSRFPSFFFGSLKDILWIFYWSTLERILISALEIVK